MALLILDLKFMTQKQLKLILICDFRRVVYICLMCALKITLKLLNQSSVDIN